MNELLILITVLINIILTVIVLIFTYKFFKAFKKLSVLIDDEFNFNKEKK